MIGSFPGWIASVEAMNYGKFKEIEMSKFRQMHSEFFNSEEQAQDCIDFYENDGEPFDDPEIHGPDSDGKYAISALYEK